MDDKIYELMAQAEILQEHALELQNKASEATSVGSGKKKTAFYGHPERMYMGNFWSAGYFSCMVFYGVDHRQLER